MAENNDDSVQGLLDSLEAFSKLIWDTLEKIQGPLMDLANHPEVVAFIKKNEEAEARELEHYKTWESLRTHAKAKMLEASADGDIQGFAHWGGVAYWISGLSEAYSVEEEFDDIDYRLSAMDYGRNHGREIDVINLCVQAEHLNKMLKARHGSYKSDPGTWIEHAGVIMDSLI